MSRTVKGSKVPNFLYWSSRGVTVVEFPGSFGKTYTHRRERRQAAKALRNGCELVRRASFTKAALCLLAALACSTAAAQAPPGLICPPGWTVVRQPSRVVTIYMHPSVDSIQVKGGVKPRDCVAQACANIGRVCGVAFRPVGSGPAEVQVFGRSRAQLGAAGYCYPAPSPWIGIASDAFGGGPHDSLSLIAIVQHEICHKALGSCGWPGGHAPQNVAACMNPIDPMRARYPGTNEGVTKHGEAGFVWREIGYLQARHGGLWLWYANE